MESVREAAGQQKLSYAAGGVAAGTVTWENSVTLACKAEHLTSPCPVNAIPGPGTEGNPCIHAAEDSPPCSDGREPLVREWVSCDLFTQQSELCSESKEPAMTTRRLEHSYVDES